MLNFACAAIGCLSFVKSSYEFYHKRFAESKIFNFRYSLIKSTVIKVGKISIVSGSERFQCSPSPDYPNMFATAHYTDDDGILF